MSHDRMVPNFQNCLHCEKDLKDNKHNSLYLGQKCTSIFLLGNYLFWEAHSFPWATLSENCSLLGTDNVHGQISLHICAPNFWRGTYIHFPTEGATVKETNWKEIGGCTQTETAFKNLHVAAFSPEARKICRDPSFPFFLRRAGSCRQDKAGNAASRKMENDSYHAWELARCTFKQHFLNILNMVHINEDNDEGNNCLM